MGCGDGRPRFEGITCLIVVDSPLIATVQIGGAMSNLSRRRWARRLLSVAGVEHRSPILASAFRPASLRVAGSMVWRRDQEESLLPAALRPNRDERARPMWAPVKADLVAAGRFDVDGYVKLRSFYIDSGLSVRVQAGRREKQHGVSRTLEAYRRVVPHIPAIMPRIDDHGSAPPFRGGVYLVEELVMGSHPVSRDEIQELAEPLAGLLHRLHRGVGVASHPLSATVHRKMPERWSAFVREFGVDGALDAAVRRLIERDELVEISLAHGDLVASNIMVNGGRIVLIDWEHAGEKPIAFDLAKIHLNSRDPVIAQANLERGLEHSVGHRSGHYSFAEQLALAHVQMLSQHQTRATRAAKAGRSGALAAQTRARLKAITRLLDVDATALAQPDRCAAI